MKYLIGAFLFIDGIGAGASLEKAHPTKSLHDSGWYWDDVGQYVCYAALAFIILSTGKKDKQPS